MSIFCSEWKSEKIGDILKERKEIGFSNLPLLSVTAEKGVVKRNEIDIKDNSSSDKSNYKRICPFDIGYNTMRMWQGRSGVSEYEGIVSPAYTVLKPTSKVDSNFIGYLFKLPAMINIFRRYSQGLVNDTLSLKYNQLKNITVKIPSFGEQKKIARILNVWDEAITLQKDLIELKKEQKKGLMNELFLEEKRIPGFNNNWDEVELGQVAKVSTGDKNNQDKEKDGEYPFFVRSADIERINTYSYDGEAILIPGDGRIGEIFHYINGKFDFHQRVYKISDFGENLRGKFVYYYLERFFLKHALKFTAKATVDSLRMPMILEMKIKKPSKEEQDKIVKILSLIEKEIELLEKELEYLKEQKKGLMQLLLTGKVRVKC